jgi:hypothetical protein
MQSDSFTLLTNIDQTGGQITLKKFVMIIVILGILAGISYGIYSTVNKKTHDDDEEETN